VTSIILLEGPDLAGKSTLATQLGADTVLRSGPPPRGTCWEHEYVARLFKAPLGNRVVLDRWHYGELVYPQIIGRPSFMTPAQASYVDRILEGSCDVYLKVLLLPSADLLEHRFATRGDKLFGIEDILKARLEYVKIVDRFDLVLRTDEDVARFTKRVAAAGVTLP